MKTRKALSAGLAFVMMLGLTCGVLFAETPLENVNNSKLGNSVSEKQTGEPAEIKFDYESEDAMLADMKAVAENNRFILYYSGTTMAVAVREKSNGRIYTSNPFNSAKDSACVGNTEKLLESQVTISYIDVNERQQKLEMYSSSDCAELGQFAYTEYENGVAFSVVLGKQSEGKLVPAAMTEEFFNKVVGRLEGRPARRMKVFYERYSLEDDVSQSEKKSIISRYPGIKDGAVYVALDLSERESNEIEEYLNESGFTAEDIKNDLKRVGLKTEEDKSPSFAMDIEYILTDDGLTVNIPNSSISYDSQNYQLLSLRLLPYMGAETPKAGGEGYLFFPDGSGSVIEMDGQDENRRSVMTLSVYGFDAGNELDVDTRAGEQCYLPVYGIHGNDAGDIFAVIESGDEVAAITAQLGQPNGNYYTVYPTFTIANEKHIQRDAKVSSLGSKQMIYLVEKGETPYSGDITVSYYLLNGKNGGYVGMAECYRRILSANGMTENRKTISDIAVETVGTALYTEEFLGFKYNKQAKFTTYSQNIEIAQKLKEQGVDALTLRLLGWQKYGLDGSVSNKMRIASVLGGKSEFKKLIKYARENSVTLLPEADLLFATNDRLFDGFSSNSDGIRQLDYIRGGIADYRPDIDDFGKLRIGVSPTLYDKYFQDFFKGYAAYKLSSVSLGTAGTYLNSDYSRKNMTNRGETRKTIEALLKSCGKDYSLSFTGANAYVLPYADSFSGISTTDSRYLGESYSVPFVQLAVSGCAEVQSMPINLEDDISINILRCIETGTVPLFTVCCDNVEDFKRTDYSKYYSISFEVQQKNIASAAEQFKKVKDASAGTRMVSHKRVADGVFASGYENGAVIYVNYNNTAYVSGNITVAANSFCTVFK